MKARSREQSLSDSRELDGSYDPLTDIRQQILDKDNMFNSVEAISLTSIARMLKRHQVSLKQLNCFTF
ncbi:hypothetical protein UPYG_G00060300 [Umbra pygmaea]|uniref:Uncharacterized protein n=1 Tax=Umbra pygmaea TaxID=75934 RepID=A0ABD0XYP7_UMBPY